MSSINRVVVTGDFLRVNAFGAPSQTINIDWLYSLLSGALELTTPLPLKKLVFDSSTSGLSKKLYETNGLPPTVAGWAKLFNKEPSTRDLALVYDSLADSLVISFEIPEFVRKALERLGIPYFDFTVHPARFLEDILFGIRSNVVGIESGLSQSTVKESEIRVGASLAAASLVRLPRIKRLEGLSNAALFAAQTPDDKVLIKDGSFLGVSDVFDKLEAMCAAHEVVFVKPHPYAKANTIVLALTRLFPNAILIDSNFYHLLSHDQLSTVYSITSSTSVEAAYFGKTGVHMARYPYLFSDSCVGAEGFVPIWGDFFLPDFWTPLLKAAGVPTKDTVLLGIRRAPNRMRKSLRNSWGADIFEN